MKKKREEKKSKNDRRSPRQRDRDRVLVRNWTDVWIPAGLEARKRFIEDLEKVERYFESDHDELYSKLGKWFNTQGTLCLTVNLAQQVRGYLGPHLYARNPVRTVTSTTNAPEFQALARVVDAYLNATPEDTRLMLHERDKVDEALVAGRGVSWTQKDESTGLICTKHVPVRDVILDPDARRADEIQWVAIKKQEPLHVVKRRYGSAAKDLKPSVLAPSDQTRDKRVGEGKPMSDHVSALQGSCSYVCHYYVIYSKMGSGMTHGRLSSVIDESDEHRGSDGDSKLFKKLVLVPGYDRPLYEGKWDLSLYLDDDWPVGFLDFHPTLKGSKGAQKDANNGGLYPPSTMKLGLAHQEAIDILATRLVNDLMNRSRLIAALQGGGEASKRLETALKSGEPWAVVKVDDSAQVPARDMLHRLDLGQVDPNYMQQLQWHEDKFGEITGLNPVLKGGMDTRQMRSAMEAEMRDRNSRSRLEDMASQVESAAKYIARREGLAVRLDLEPAEVERVVKDRLDLGLWKVIVTVNGKSKSVRELREEGMFPEAGRYFESKEEAKQVAQGILARDEQLKAAHLMENPEAPWGGTQAYVTELDVEEIWIDTSGLTPRELAMELNYRVEAGSARRPDHNKRIEEAEQNFAALGPVLLQLQQYEEYNDLLRNRYEAHQTPKARRVFVNAQSAAAFLQAQQQAQQQQAQLAQQQHQSDQQHDLTKIQVQEQARAQREIATTAAATAMDPVGGGGYQ